MLLNESAEPTDLPLSLLKEITNDFSDHREIGRGGFAVVYKGVLRNGTVAVKKLSNSHMHELKFHQEVECLLKVRHNNIVRFLGYCADTQGKASTYEGKFVMADVQARVLCFEFIPKGTLRDYMNGASGGLEWKIWYQIIKGICNGLHCLHQNRIVHLDLKPTNILLDGDMVPKIADFGLSRCFNEQQSQAITSKLFGSVGYFPPEFCNGLITFKSDIFSLGVIIIEILTGEKGCRGVEEVLEICRNRLEISPASDMQLEQIRVCAEIGIQCTEFNPGERPVIMDIINRLELDETESMDKSFKFSLQRPSMDNNHNVAPDHSMHAETSRGVTIQDLVVRACEYPLAPTETKRIVVELPKDWILIYNCGVTLENFPGLVEHNPSIAAELLSKLINSPDIYAYVANLMDEETGIYLKKFDKNISPSRLMPECVSKCIRLCGYTKEKHVKRRLVRLFCVFLHNIIKNKIINAPDLLLEVQAFCMEFSGIREAACLLQFLNCEGRSGL